MNIEDFRTYCLSFKGAYAKTKFEKAASGNGIREIYGDGGKNSVFFMPRREPEGHLDIDKYCLGISGHSQWHVF